MRRKLCYTHLAMQKNTIRILVIIDSNFKARRDKLLGVYDYAHRHKWLIQSIEKPMSEKRLDAIIHELSPNGIIIDGFNPPTNLPKSLKKRIPVIYIDSPTSCSRFQKTRSINNDNGACAELAARTLLNLQLASYAVVSSEVSTYWSEIRVKAFAAHIKSAGCHCDVFIPRDRESARKLTVWLASLPKPCGIFAVTDLVARRVINACTNLDISVPEEVAVVGLDNDEMICESTTPSITSVLPDFKAAGFLAAEKLDQIIHGTDDGITCSYGPKTIVKRASTFRPAYNARKITSVLDYIRQNACTGINVSDVVMFSGLPKSTLELHFRKATQSTITQEIQRNRMEQVLKILAESDCPIGLIAERCGYGTDNHLKKAFRQKFGMTMSKWRAQRS